MSSSTSFSKLEKLLPQMYQATQPPGESYLRFQLTAEMTGLLSMEHVRESLLVPASQITPLPNMPGPVVGLMGSREHVFCAIDLAQLLGLPSSLVYSQQYHVVVVRVPQSGSQQPSADRESFLGIVVKRVQGMTRLISENLQGTVGDFSSSLTPYLSGCVVEKEEQLLVLDARAITTSSLLYNNLA